VELGVGVTRRGRGSRGWCIRVHARTAWRRARRWRRRDSRGPLQSPCRGRAEDAPGVLDEPSFPPDRRGEEQGVERRVVEALPACGPPILRAPTATELAALAYCTIAVTAVVLIAWYGQWNASGGPRRTVPRSDPVASLAAVALVGSGTITPLGFLGALAVLAGVILGLGRASRVPVGTANGCPGRDIIRAKRVAARARGCHRYWRDAGLSFVDTRTDTTLARLLATPFSSASRSYLAWVKTRLRPSSSA
jgi:hypothetical protein